MDPSYVTAIIAGAAALIGTIVGGVMQILLKYFDVRHRAVSDTRKAVHELAMEVQSYLTASYQALADMKKFGKQDSLAPHYERLHAEINRSYNAAEGKAIALFMSIDARVGDQAMVVQDALTKFNNEYGECLVRPGDFDLDEMDVDRANLRNSTNVMLTMVEPQIGAKVWVFKSAKDAQNRIDQARLKTSGE
jgi:hypothetical protein